MKVGQTIVFCGLSGVAFGPRNPMKNRPSRDYDIGGAPHHAVGSSTLSALAKTR
jgi:hypothetical protein